MDGTGVRRSRSTEDTTQLPRMDDDRIGQHERAAAPRLTGAEYASQPGWYDRLHAEVDKTPTAPVYDRRLTVKEVRPGRHQAAKDDLPGPSRRELARLVRQVRALVIVNLLAGLAGGVAISWLIFR
jgi:hypothetical protein